MFIAILAVWLFLFLQSFFSGDVDLAVFGVPIIHLLKIWLWLFLKLSLYQSVFQLSYYHRHPKNFVSYTINGIVLNKETGNPIPGVYLYVVKGEEEALTNNKGAFQLVTWQKLPATLHLHYKEDEQVRVVVTKTDQPVTIKL